MTKVKTSTSRSDLSDWVNAPEFEPKIKHLPAKDQIPYYIKKRETVDRGLNSSNWVKATEFVPNANAKNQSNHFSIKNITSSSGPDLTKSVNAPEFVPYSFKIYNKGQRFRKGKLSSCGPNSPNWVKASEFVPNTTNLNAKNQSNHSSIKCITSSSGPDLTKLINAPEFVPSSNKVCSKGQRFKKGKLSSCGPNSPNWVNAPEFVPKAKKSFAYIVKSNVCATKLKTRKLDMELCMHFFEGKCPYNEECPCIHGDLCELCRKYCLNPFDERKRKYHIEYCEKELEQDMELSFAIQRSFDKTCGICMDVIIEKEPASERRFGILEKCNHVFCLPCIRKWRSVKTFENVQQIDNVLNPDVNRACPECRVPSGFITPSRYWVDSEEEKKKLIADYKGALSKKPCKYFKRGKGTCPFGGACFYLHANPDGIKVDLPLPSRRRWQNQNGEIDFMTTITLWDYLEVRN